MFGESRKGSDTLQHAAHTCFPHRRDHDDIPEATFDLSRQDEDVLLVITHRKLQNRKAVVGVAAGWHTHLTILEDVLRSRTPGAFWRTFNPLENEYERRVTPDAERSR